MCTHLILLNLVREIGFDRWVSIAYAEWFRKVVLDKWILSSLIKDRLNPILRILQIHIIKVWYTNRQNWKLPDPFNQVSSCIRYPSNESYPYLRFRITFYYIDKSVLVENRPLVKFMRNYNPDLRSVFFYIPPHSWGYRWRHSPRRRMLIRRRKLYDLKLFKEFLASEGGRRGLQEIPAADQNQLQFVLGGELWRIRRVFSKRFLQSVDRFLR